MGAIWFLSPERNMMITGFNKVEKDGKTELWVKELDGSSRKIAVNQQAHDLENALLDIAWSNSPAIISDGKGRFSSNINLEEEEEVE